MDNDFARFIVAYLALQLEPSFCVAKIFASEGESTPTHQPLGRS